MAGQLLGPAANAGSWGRDRVYVRALSIAGGTTQVNKNIVAQRVLGLPRS
jgi:alkylation response protein AidB-like acyl-CoA dehydrogenase